MSFLCRLKVLKSETINEKTKTKHCHHSFQNQSIKMEGTDCLECRVASGGGLIFASIYLYCQASNKTRFNKAGIIFVSAGKSTFKKLH